MKYRRYRCACPHFSIWNAKIIKHFSGMRKKFDRQIKMVIWNMSIGKCVLLCSFFWICFSVYSVYTLADAEPLARSIVIFVWNFDFSDHQGRTFDWTLVNYFAHLPFIQLNSFSNDRYFWVANDKKRVRTIYCKWVNQYICCLTRSNCIIN